MRTTDDPHEAFDTVDENDRVIGQATRSECNTNPDLIHRAVFILIYDDQGRILWQKRSMTKDTCPGQWVTSASGHVDAGEDYSTAAHREVREELGIDVPVTFVGKFLYRYRNESEYSAVFRGSSDGPFPYNREEIEAVRFMTVDEMLAKDRRKEVKLARAAHNIIESLGSRVYA